MPENYAVKGYEFGGDDDFPWFPNEVVPLLGEEGQGVADASTPRDGEVSARGDDDEGPAADCVAMGDNAADDVAGDAADENAPTGEGIEGAPSATITEDTPADA